MVRGGGTLSAGSLRGKDRSHSPVLQANSIVPPPCHELRCTQVATDGLRADPGDIARCLGPYRKCVDNGCLWRKWHMIPHGQMMPLSPPPNTDLI